MTLKDAQLLSRVYTIATHSLSGFLKQTGSYEQLRIDELNPKLGKLALEVVSKCRCELASYLSTPSAVLKQVSLIANAHDDWDKKALKEVSVDVDLSSEDESRVNTTPLKSRPQRKRARYDKDFDETLPKKPKVKPIAPEVKVEPELDYHACLGLLQERVYCFCA